MKLSKLLVASAVLMTAFTASTSNSEARNPAKGTGRGSSGSSSALAAVPTVFAAECGTSSATFAQFAPPSNTTGAKVNPNNPNTATGLPLSVAVNESTVLTSGYAGDLVFIPTTSLSLTNLATFTPMTQGTYQESVSVRPKRYTGSPALEFALAFSWKDLNGNTQYGVSFVPSTFVTNVTPVTNHSLKLKSVDSFVTVNTNLQTIFTNGGLNSGGLINVLPAPNNAQPDINSTNYQLLGIGSALVNTNTTAGTDVSAIFGSFKLNNSLLPEAYPSQFNINCAPLLPVTGAL
ncbi:MAG TPA: hypothetical protein V6C89_15100 [Drouetiella sp.]